MDLGPEMQGLGVFLLRYRAPAFAKPASAGEGRSRYLSES
jgi:hypothetical protein